MVESETLQFENGRALQNLYANDLRLLQALEEKLDLKVTTRDGWLRLEGEGNNIEKALVAAGKNLDRLAPADHPIREVQARHGPVHDPDGRAHDRQLPALRHGQALLPIAHRPQHVR